MMPTLPRRLSLGQLPTPLHRLYRAEKRWGKGHRLWIKRDDLTGCLLTGNKVRKLEFIAAHAIDNGFDTLLTCGAVQSNHCRATALVGAQLGLAVHLVLAGPPDELDKGNFFLDKLSGAKISHYDKSEYKKNLDSILLEWQDHYARKDSKALVIPTGGSDGLGIWGYIAAAQEISNDLKKQNITESHIVCATGSGGTQAGLSIGAEIYNLPALIWGVNVSDNADYFIRKIKMDFYDLKSRSSGFENMDVKVRILDGYVGEGYGKADAVIYKLISELASLEGIILDPVYTGKAFQGMLAEIAKGTFSEVKDIIFVHTGGIFGLFASSEGIYA